MVKVLVVSKTGVVGALVLDALDYLGKAHDALDFLPTGSLTERAEIWLDILETYGPDVVFLNHMVVGRDGAAADSGEAARAFFAAAERSTQPSRIVLLSSGEIYGAGSGDPTFVTEAWRPSPPLSRSSRILTAAESAAADCARLRPDLTFALLRPTQVLGDVPHGVLAAHLVGAGGRVGVEAGYDPQVQFMTDHDLAVICLRALYADTSGVFNIAPNDAVVVSDAIRVAAKRRVPTTRTATIFGRFFGFGRPWPQELAHILMYGRALDPTRAARNGWEVKSSSAAALAGAFR